MARLFEWNTELDDFIKHKLFLMAMIKTTRFDLKNEKVVMENPPDSRMIEIFSNEWINLVNLFDDGATEKDRDTFNEKFSEILKKLGNLGGDKKFILKPPPKEPEKQKPMTLSISRSESNLSTKTRRQSKKRIRIGRI